jgi:hypothetical protein
MRLWTNGKFQMMIDLWEENYWEYQRQPMATKNWKKIIDKIDVAFPLRCHILESSVKTKSPR